MNIHINEEKKGLIPLRYVKHIEINLYEPSSGHKVQVLPQKIALIMCWIKREIVFLFLTFILQSRKTKFWTSIWNKYLS